MASTRELQDRATMSRTGTPYRGADELPYHIELWRHGTAEEVERVLARAANAALARSIFKAAAGEYPERRVTLRKGNRTMADSSG